MRRRKTTTVSEKGRLRFTKAIMGRSISTRKKKVVRQSDSERDAELCALSLRVGLSSSSESEEEASEVSNNSSVGCLPAAESQAR